MGAALVAAMLFAGLPLRAQWWNPVSWGEEREVLPVLQPPTPEEEAQAQELFAEAQRLQSEGRLDAAKDRYEKIVEDLRRTVPAPEAQFQIAKIAADRGNYQKAFTLCQRTIARYPDYEGFTRVIGEQFEIATILAEGKRRLLLVIPIPRPLDRARIYFERVIANAPYSEYAPLALMNIALIAEKQEKEDVAIDALDRPVSFYPEHMLAPDAYLMLADVYAGLVRGAPYDQASTREAISYYEDYLVLFPNDEEIVQAEEGLAEMQNTIGESKFVMGDFYHRYRRNETAALVFYNEAITLAPNSEAAEAARERIASIENDEPPPPVGIGLGRLFGAMGGLIPGIGGGDGETSEDAAAEVETQ